MTRRSIGPATFYCRAWLGRILIHVGLKVLPPGRGRQELTQLLWTWRMKVDATLAAHRSIGPAPGRER